MTNTNINFEGINDENFIDVINNDRTTMDSLLNEASYSPTMEGFMPESINTLYEPIVEGHSESNIIPFTTKPRAKRTLFNFAKAAALAGIVTATLMSCNDKPTYDAIPPMVEKNIPSYTLDSIPSNTLNQVESPTIIDTEEINPGYSVLERAKEQLLPGTLGYEYPTLGKSTFGEPVWADAVTGKGLSEGEKPLTLGEVKALQKIRTKSVQRIDELLKESETNPSILTNYTSSVDVHNQLEEEMPETGTIYNHKDKGRVASVFGSEYTLGNEQTSVFVSKGHSGLERFIETETGNYHQANQAPITHGTAALATYISVPTHSLDNLTDKWVSTSENKLNKGAAHTVDFITGFADSAVKTIAYAPHDLSEGIGAGSRAVENTLDKAPRGLKTVSTIAKVPFSFISNLFGRDNVEQTDDLAMNGTEHIYLQGIGGGLRTAAYFSSCGNNTASGSSSSSSSGSLGNTGGGSMIYNP